MQAILAQTNAMIADVAPATACAPYWILPSLAHPRAPVCVGACCLVISLAFFVFCFCFLFFVLFLLRSCILVLTIVVSLVVAPVALVVAVRFVGQPSLRPTSRFAPSEVLQ